VTWNFTELGVSVRFQRAVRLIASAALLGSASLAVLLPASPVFAKGTKPTEVTCTTLSAVTSVVLNPANTINFSGCTDPSITGGGGSLPITGRTITWDTGLTTIIVITKSRNLKDHCMPPIGDTNQSEAKISGTISGGTATALINGKWKHKICNFLTANQADTVSEYFPGTVGKY
jgi:hypothetical protein